MPLSRALQPVEGTPPRATTFKGFPTPHPAISVHAVPKMAGVPLIPNVTSVPLVPCAPKVPWKDPDVHSWSARMRTVLTEEWPSLPQESTVAEQRWEAIPQEIKAALPPTVVAKIVGRRGVTDRDLCGALPLGLLVMACEIRGLQVSDLVDCLQDVGQTCLQGDTHRLFSFLLAHRRDAAAAAQQQQPQ